MHSFTLFRGTLFAEDFLGESITETSAWQNISETALDKFESELRRIIAGLPLQHKPNEAQTEDDLIWPIIERLGWTKYLRQQSLSAHGRMDVPDGVLFQDDNAKTLANSYSDEWRRDDCGSVMVESKRWLRPLDRRSGTVGEESAQSTQILRYLRRVDDLTSGKLRWGILTNGAHWRLYYSGARLVSEDYFEN